MNTNTKPLLNIGAAYIRVSDERQDEYSPDSQLKKIREYAAKEGYLIPDEYVFYDDGISAKSVKHRTEFNRMVATAKEKDRPFEVIYVWKFSRFARNQEESMVYKNLLRKKGVSVISVSEPIPEGHFGTLIERIIEWMDEFYLINLGAEVTRGMTEKASRGEPVCAPPYGYVMKDKKYIPDESGPADIVREVFERFVAGEAKVNIAKDIASKGVRTKFGNLPENRWIDYILYNPTYIGKIRWSLDGTRAASRRDFNNENIMIVDGHHEPLISTELWEAAQKRQQELKDRYPKFAKREQPIQYMLKGMVKCSACGSTLAANGVSGKDKTRCLQCCNYARGTCSTSHGITVPKLEAAFIESLNQAVKTKEFKISPQKSKKKSNSKAPDYDKLIALDKRRLERAKEAYLSEIDTIEQYKQNKAEIEKHIEELKAMRDNSKPQEKFDPDAFSARVVEVIEFIKRDDVTPKAKNEVLHSIIDKVIFEKANKNLAIYFRP